MRRLFYYTLVESSLKEKAGKKFLRKIQNNAMIESVCPKFRGT